MEITWTYNFLESIAFIGLVILGIWLVAAIIVYLITWLAFRPK